MSGSADSPRVNRVICVFELTNYIVWISLKHLHTEHMFHHSWIFPCRSFWGVGSDHGDLIAVDSMRWSQPQPQSNEGCESCRSVVVRWVGHQCPPVFDVAQLVDAGGPFKPGTPSWQAAAALAAPWTRQNIEPLLLWQPCHSKQPSNHWLPLVFACHWWIMVNPHVEMFATSWTSRWVHTLCSDSWNCNCSWLHDIVEGIDGSIILSFDSRFGMLVVFSRFWRLADEHGKLYDITVNYLIYIYIYMDCRCLAGPFWGVAHWTAVWQPQTDCFIPFKCHDISWCFVVEELHLVLWIN